MQVRASAIDINLTTDTKHTKILAEASIDPRTWYWLHDLRLWTNYLAADRSAWRWYNTIGTSTTPDSRGGNQDPDLIVNPGAGFNWVSYLAD